MYVLITSDTVGGVWTYTQELVTGLIHAGHRVTLVSFGKLPLPHQTAWMQHFSRARLSSHRIPSGVDGSLRTRTSRNRNATSSC